MARPLTRISFSDLEAEAVSMRLDLSISHKSSWLNSVFLDSYIISDRVELSFASSIALSEGTPEDTKSS